MKRSSILSLGYLCLVVTGFIIFDQTIFSLVNRSHNIPYEVPPVGATLLGSRTVINKSTYNDIAQPPYVKPYLNDKLPATGQVAKRLARNQINLFKAEKVSSFYEDQPSN